MCAIQKQTFCPLRFQWHSPGDVAGEEPRMAPLIDDNPDLIGRLVCNTSMVYFAANLS
jgi:hypothetical protein